MASINISGYTFSTTSVPTTPALKVESGTGTYYVNLTTGQRPEALSYQKVFTVSTTNYSFLRPFVTSNSFMGYSGVSNNSTITTGYSGVSNNSTVTTGYAGVSNNSTVTTGYSGISNNSTITTGYSGISNNSTITTMYVGFSNNSTITTRYFGISSRSSTYGYSGYSSFASDVTTTVKHTVTTLSVSMYTSSLGYYVYAATFSPIAPVQVTYHYVQGATSIATSSISKGKVWVFGYGGKVGQPHALFSINNITKPYKVYLTKNYTGTTGLTEGVNKITKKNTTVSTTTDRSGVLLSQVPLTRSSSYSTTSAAVGNLSSATALTNTTTRYVSCVYSENLSSATALTNTTTRYSSSVYVGNLSNTTGLTNTATRYSSSVAVGNLSYTTALTNTATRYSSSTEKAYLSSITDLTRSTTRYSSSVAVGNLSSTTEIRTITRV